MFALVTGGAGFIGANLVHRLLERGDDVVLFDSLARRGAERNVAWLRAAGAGRRLRVVRADLRDPAAVRKLFAGRAALPIDAVFHLAAQVAVTTSVRDPRLDFEINALGTFNLLEAARAGGRRPTLIYASTNKVFGEMPDLRVRAGRTRYRPLNYTRGIPETYPLDFHSPYGCSKGAADQYVRDYHRSFGLPTVSFRQSCIYGNRQFGTEDQGWLAWISACALAGRPVTIFGDGKQVRDVLYVDDLVDAYLACAAHIDRAAGRVYNIGGGPQNTLSLLELIALLERLLGRPVACRFGDWRIGDQKFFCCDIARARKEFGWSPKIGVADGVARLVDWLRPQLDVIFAGV
ncbi:MAG: SDR family NAD(P)-dependent oxidoreductase [Planctomycetes bacterium]|nr:SDR family NAD(P)-dependent oxidoreductase [Planctomycetota bacterium]